MQTTNTVLLIRPANFGFNTETEASNAFQNKVSESEQTIKQKALAEFEAFASLLKSKGVNVIVFDDTPLPQKPDAIFPNNWVSFHADGTVILYPMFAQNRRLERRHDIIESLKKEFIITQVIDLSGYEAENKFLEGTGSIIFDHDHKIAYACLSPRTDKELFFNLCERLQYKPVCFHSQDKEGQEIYHTNVMMCIGEKFAVICSDTIADERERENVLQSLTQTGHEIIEVTTDQMNHFAGNMLAIKTKDNKAILALSQSAFDSLTVAQRQAIGKFCELVPLAIPTIETIGGGSARCMIAELFISPILT